MFAILRITLLIALALMLALSVLVVSHMSGTVLVVVAVIAIVIRRRTRASDAHGSARWAEPRDVPHMLSGSGLILGHMNGRVSKLWSLRSLCSFQLSAREACHRFLYAFGTWFRKPVARLTTSIHTAVFAPTGVGKGVSVVIPHLLTCPDSMVVIDPKGENYSLTADARRAMGHHVVILDPFQNASCEPDTLNPVEFIDPHSPTALDDCRDLTESLVLRTGQEKEPHWADSAEVWIAAMTGLIVSIAKGEDKSLQAVRTLLTNPDDMQAAINLMCTSEAMDGMLARLGHQLTQFKDKELSSTLTTTNRFLRFLDTGAVANSTRRSSFRPADLLKGKMTIYLVLPPDRMRAQAALLRLWIGCLLRTVVQGGLQESVKVHFVLDEAASLGHLNALDDAIDKYRGYGVRLLLLYQSLGQLKACFPDGQEQTLLSNVTQVFFGVNDQQTAEYVSARLGEATITTHSGGTNSGKSTQQSHQGETTSYSSGTSTNWQFMGRKLLKPEEVTALDNRTAITFVPGLPPIATRLVRYYEKGFKTIEGPGSFLAAVRVLCFLLATAAMTLVIVAVMVEPQIN